MTLARPPTPVPRPAADPPADLVPPAAGSWAGLMPHQLPPVEAELAGRGYERGALAAALRGNPQVVVVTGPAGTGKTTLATHAAHTVAAEFPDGQVVVELDRDGDTAAPSHPVQVLAAVLRALTGQLPGSGAAPDPRTLVELATAYRSVASHRRALILLDGAADTEQVRPLLTGTDGPTLLVTSRRRRLPLPGPAHHLPVAPLPLPEAVAVLTRYAGAVRAGDEPAAVEELARRCHGLPLALRIVGEWLARRPALPARLLATHLARRPLDGLRIGNLSVRAVLAADLRAVVAEDPLAEPVFRLLGQADTATPEELAGPASTDPSRVFFTLERLLDRWLADSPEPCQYRVIGLARAYATELASGDAPPNK